MIPSKRSFLAGAALALCLGLAGAHADDAKIFHGVGKVTAVDAAAGLVMLDHEEIPGLMDAMEMQYQVKPASKAAGLAVGDRVDFDVDGRNLAIIDIRKAPAKK